MIRLDHARENVHQCRLAGAILAEQRMDLAPLEVEIDAAQRLRAAEALDDAAHGEQRGSSARVHLGLPQDSRSTIAASR